MKITYYKFINDLVYEIKDDEKLEFINDLRYDGEKIVDPRNYNTFFIDEKGIKHIKKFKDSWQELKCKFDDELVFDKTLKKWRVKTEKEKLKEEKEKLIKQMKEEAYNFIVSYYPLWKQNSDLSDKEVITTKIIANFKNVINETDIRKSIYDILSGNSTIYKELVNYGIKAGLIETDENNLPLYKYILKDGKTIIANISGIYKDEKGNKKQINFDNVKDRFLLFKNGVDPNLINTSVKLVEKLVKIAKRISWKNKVREKVDEIENKIKQANNLNELHKIDIYEFIHILPDFIENKKHI